MHNPLQSNLKSLKAEDHVSLLDYEIKTILVIKDFLRLSKNPVLAYSGGKDSVVLSHIVKKHFGIKKAVCEISLSFKKSEREVKEIANHLGLYVEYKNRLSLKWLEKNQKFLWPKIGTAAGFYTVRQQATIKDYLKKTIHDGVITGRRYQENTIKSPIYQTADGSWNCHPLYFWNTDNIWQYHLENDLPHLSIYNHPIGFADGAASWVSLGQDRFGPLGYDVLELIYDYDPSPLYEIRGWCERADTFLNKKESEK